MFRPNLTGKISKSIGFDRYGQPAYGDENECPFAIVRLSIGMQKTSVRTDSSASRGAADEVVAEARILIAKYVKPDIGDIFRYDEREYLVSGVFARRSVLGILDHYECTLEILP